MIREHPLVQLTLTRLREFIREPEAVFWVFIFPILLAAGLGLAFQRRPDEIIRIAVAAEDSVFVQETLRALAGEAVLRAEAMPDSAAAMALRTGTVALIVEPRTGGGVRYRYDDTRSEGRAARLLADRAVQRAGGRRDPVESSDMQARERGSRYIDFVIPGLLGMNIMGSGIWGIGFGIVTARTRKLLKRFVATPMSRAHYLLSFLLFRLFLLVVEVVVLTGFGALAFGVPMRGSLAQFAVICLVSSMAFGALGLLIASRARTIEGASGLMNLAMLPMWVASGVFFSAANFPDSVQPLIQALPLTAVNDALRANMLQGAGWASVAPELAIVTAWMAVSFALALRLFRWR